MNEPQKSETKTEALEREIKSIEDNIKRLEEAEAQARKDCHWQKKRLRLVKAELAELKEI